MYSAYYDDREKFGNKSFVRIIGLMDTIGKTNEFICKLWFKTGEEKVAISNIDVEEIWDFYPKKEAWGTIIITCQIHQANYGHIPFAVSVTDNSCHSLTNLMRVDYLQPQNNSKQNFGVCVKGLDFPFQDVSIKIVEWLELLFILGVGKVYFYTHNLHPNISKVLQHYEKKGKVEAVPINLPGGQPDSPQGVHELMEIQTRDKRAQEKLHFQDCFYKNMYKYRYIAILDTDEVIVPRKVKYWGELLDIYESQQRSKNCTCAYTFNRTISLDSMRQAHVEYDSHVPEYMNMLQNVYRSPLYETLPKYIADTDHIVGLGNHRPMTCKRECKILSVPVDVAHTVHFRAFCKAGRNKMCDAKAAIPDLILLRYQDPLVERVTSSLKALQLL
ncbi:unnamed protein product [Meganyctiphanes norvegica]|uniref:Glycosyltransferase family 92 protein n=1 Tax=Meganyctiphanes norvegica TaxID=48144 RepID=A0AAV2SPT8_MEGNR